MKIVSEVHCELGKAGLNLGQAVIIAALVGRFFTQQPIAWGITFSGIAVGALLVIVSLASVQKGYLLRKLEELPDESHG